MNPYQQGRQCRLLGFKVTDNPYFLGTSDWQRWRQGWLDSDKEYVK